MKPSRPPRPTQPQKISGSALTALFLTLLMALANQAIGQKYGVSQRLPSDTRIKLEQLDQLQKIIRRQGVIDLPDFDFSKETEIKTGKLNPELSPLDIPSSQNSFPNLDEAQLENLDQNLRLLERLDLLLPPSNTKSEASNPKIKHLDFSDPATQKRINELFEEVRSLTNTFASYQYLTGKTSDIQSYQIALDLSVFLESFSNKNPSPTYFSEAVLTELSATTQRLAKDYQQHQDLVSLLEYNDIKDFQSRQQLPADGRLTPETRLAIQKAERHTADQLQQIGIFEESLEAQLKRYRSARKIEDELQEQLKKDVQEQIWITQNGEVFQRTTFQTENQQEFDNYIAVRESRVFFRFSGNQPIDQTLKNIRKQLNQKLATDQLEILSLVKDQSTEQLLKRQFKGQTTKFKLTKGINQQDLKKALSKSKKKTVFVMGHIEGQDFVTYHRGEEIFRVEVGQLMQLGEELDLNIFPFGCNSVAATDGAVGTTQYLNSVSDTRRLIAAMENSKSMGEVLQKYAGDDRVIVIDEETFLDRNYSAYKFYQKTVKTGGVVTISLGGTLYWFRKDLLPLLNEEKDEKEEPADR